MKNSLKFYAHFTFILICLIGIAKVEGQSIISLAGWEETELTQSQADNFAKVNNLSADYSILKVNIGDISSVSNNLITIDMPNSACGEIIFKGKHVEFESDQDYSWYGEMLDTGDEYVCKFGSLLLMAKNGQKFGHIQLEDEFYSIEDIGEGKNIIIKYPIEDESINFCGGATAPDFHEEPTLGERGIGNCDVTVLALYTTAANNRAVGINNLINLTITQANQALRNSAVNSSDLNLKLVATEAITINETDQSFNAVLSAVRSPASGAPNRRNVNDADIVILFVDRSIMVADSPGGLAFLGLSNTSAYGVVRTIGVANGFVVAHEIGHILGLRHELCAAENVGINCDDVGVFEHAHTWSYETGWLWKKEHIKKTIMYSGGVGSTSQIIQHYSNPEVEEDGRKTGIENERDNVRQLKINACTVANFRTTSDHLIVEIAGGSYMCEFESATLTASIDGAPGPYTYEWKVNGTGMNWDNTAIHGIGGYIFVSAFPTYVVGDIVYIRLRVVDGNGDVSYAYHEVEVVDDGYNGLLCFRSSETRPEQIFEEGLSIYPNPARSSTTISYTIPKPALSMLKIYSTNGTLLKTINKGELKAGNYTEKIDLSTYGSAIYYVELDLGYSKQRVSFMRIK